MKESPVILPKAIKNPTEVRGMRNANVSILYRELYNKDITPEKRFVDKNSGENGTSEQTYPEQAGIYYLKKTYLK